MSAWSGVVALSGFRYDGRTAAIEALPQLNTANFRCFWSAGTGWGTFSVGRSGVSVAVLKGKLACRSTDFRGVGGKSTATLSGKAVASRVTVRNGVARVEFDQAVTVNEGEELRVEV